MRYILTLVCFAVIVILGIITACVEKKKGLIVAILSALVIGIANYLTLAIPDPEIYTTNGADSNGNELYIKAEWPFQVYYTLTPYDDPKKNGILYTDSLSIDKTTSISAVTRLWFFRWGKVVSKDILIDENGIDIIKVDVPGTSIASITAFLNDNRYYPGTELTKSDFRVEGTTIAGEKVEINDFTFEPNVLSEGYNTIQVFYKNIKSEVNITVVEPQLISILANYIGDEVTEGAEVNKDDIVVTGLYENGQEKPITEFEYTPETVGESGEAIITVFVDEYSDTITVPVKPKQYLLTYINEIHTPSGSYEPTVDMAFWDEQNDYSIDGKTYSSGLKMKIDNWMSKMMGNGHDFAEDVEVNIYLAINQDYLSELPDDEQYLDGCFVVEKNTNGSTTTADVTILIDDVEKYQSGQITSVTTDIPNFHIPIQGASQVVIRVNAHSCGIPFILGIIV